MFGQRVSILVVIGGFVLVLAVVRRSWQPLIRFAVALALLTIVIYAFKFGVGRTAPPVDSLHADGESYPSGHVPNALLMWGLVAWLAAEYQVVDWPSAVAERASLRGAGMCVSRDGAAGLPLAIGLVAGVALGVVLLRVLHLPLRRPVGPDR